MFRKKGYTAKAEIVRMNNAGHVFSTHFMVLPSVFLADEHCESNEVAKGPAALSPRSPTETTLM